jgi:hypothetical protein
MTDMIDIGRSGWTGLVIAAGLLLALSAKASAQSGSVGGSIGKEDKSVSGSQAPAAPARSLPSPQAPSAPRAKSASRTNSGGGGGGGTGGSFDGVWTFVGVSSGNCSGSVTLSISGGRLIGEGVTGSVAANGAINAVGAANGVSGVSTGRLSGRTGSGTWQQSDGCSSRWTAQKQ